MISAISVKDRLKNQARSSGRTMQDELVTYGLERTIYRISVSEDAEHFILKGGIFLYALFEGDFVRTTRDIDLLADRISNGSDQIKRVFTDIFSIVCEDALRFDLNSMEVNAITEFKEYHGVNVSVKAYLDRTRIPISIDIGFGDVISPERVKMTFPVILDMEAPEIYAYSVYSVISEKFEAIVSLGMVNSRYKDFFDIYVLAGAYDFDGKTLQEAIIETFRHRRTEFSDIAAFDPEFADDVVRINRWNTFIRKKAAKAEPDFKDVIEILKTLLLPIVKAIKEGVVFCGYWNRELGKWTDEKPGEHIEEF